MSLDRRRLLAGLAASAPLLLLSISMVHAQGQWPERTVRIVSPYGAGGSNDISARLFAERLGKRMGQQFIVENKPGAGTRLANEFVARAPADGYTLLYAAAPFAVVESLYGKLSYDPGRDFQPVTLALVAPVFLIVNAELPVKTVADFIKYAKTKPQGINIASPGAGSGPHLTGELFMKEAGIKGLTVHFRGDATAYTELLAGRVDATITAITTALPHIKAGKLRVIAVANETRSPIEPKVPTFGEAGFPNIVGYGWFGFVVPNGTPAAVVNRLSDEVNAVLKEPDFSKRMLELGLQPRGGTPAEFAAFIVRETRKWSEVIRVAGVKGE
jgi:tripartite-type tricarboxylate transporter receptor subunit TctC